MWRSDQKKKEGKKANKKKVDTKKKDQSSTLSISCCVDRGRPSRPVHKAIVVGECSCRDMARMWRTPGLQIRLPVINFPDLRPTARALSNAPHDFYCLDAPRSRRRMRGLTTGRSTVDLYGRRFVFSSLGHNAPDVSRDSNRQPPARHVRWRTITVTHPEWCSSTSTVLCWSSGRTHGLSIKRATAECPRAQRQRARCGNYSTAVILFGT